MRKELNLNNRSVLYIVAEEVPVDEDMSGLVLKMLRIMQDSNGIGLAAPQIGESKRVIVVGTKNLRLCLINPIITKRKLGKALSEEGCLSFPGLLKKIKRDKQIVVEGFDIDWNPIKRKLRGLDAFIVQHEIDHLNGITIRNA